MTRQIFVRGTGQEDNIGDVILRRSFFEQLSAAGQLHIHLGDATEDFIAALELRESDVIYRDAESWRRAAYRSVLRKPTWLVDKPGELLLEEDIYKGQRSLLPLIVAVRARGGRSLRLGIGHRKPNPALVGRFRRLYRLSNTVAWRDVESHAHFAIGEVMPDWGFLDGSEVARAEPRGRLVVSYRSDRDMLPQHAIDAIRAFAERESLLITVVTQVARDSSRSLELHDALGGELLDWKEPANHREQEARLRDIYAETAVALSDRLHVLIVAAAEGAAPVNLIDKHDPKIARHFEAIGYRDVTVASSDATAAELVDALDRARGRGEEMMTKVSGARVRIRDIARRSLSLRS
jgi:hypothetical protein